jgi:hypothetical protein
VGEIQKRHPMVVLKKMGALNDAGLLLGSRLLFTNDPIRLGIPLVRVVK